MPKPLREIECFLLDMDGTIYLGSILLPGAKEFVEYLMNNNKKFLFFTNNPTKDVFSYSEKLQRFGFQVTEKQILTSGQATIEFLKRETTYRRLFTIAPPSFEKELKNAGFDLVEDHPDAVLLSFDTTLTYEKLRKATYWLLREVPYIATNPDFVCPTEEGPIPDCGSIAQLLLACTGREPIYIGKPNPTMIRMALHILDMPAEKTAMIGDRLYTDMEMAYRSGVTSILVLSGESTLEQALKYHRRPDYIFPSLKQVLQALED